MERIAEEPFQRRKSATTQGWSKPLRFGSGPQLGRSSASSGFPVHSGDFPALPCRPLPKPPRLEDMKQTVRKHENDEDSTNREAFSGSKEFPVLGLPSALNHDTVKMKTSASSRGLKVTAPEFKPRGDPLPLTQTSPAKITLKAGTNQRFDLSSVLQTLVTIEPRNTLTEPPSSEDTKVPAREKKEKTGKGGNLLDSSAPKTLRGKEKANPKPKKPTAMRKSVLDGRQRRRQLENLSVSSTESPDTKSDVRELDKSEDSTTCTDTSLPASDVIFLGSHLENGSPCVPVQIPSGVPSPITSMNDTKEQVSDLVNGPMISKYCDHEITAEMIVLVENILDTLVFYQDRAYKQDPLMYKRRFVCGMKDVSKHLESKEVKLIFAASNIEEGVGQHGPDQKLQAILHRAQELKVPIVFVMPKRRLGKKCKKPGNVSVVGVYNYDVAMAAVRKLLGSVDASREKSRTTATAADCQVERPETPSVHKLVEIE